MLSQIHQFADLSVSLLFLKNSILFDFSFLFSGKDSNIFIFGMIVTSYLQMNVSDLEMNEWSQGYLNYFCVHLMMCPLICSSVFPLSYA